MKTKLFFAFLTVILIALLSNFIFEWLIMRDFENYVNGVREDQLYWITTSAESSYDQGKWNNALLVETAHWAMMMGLDIKIIDASGNEIISSQNVVESLPATMKERMEGLFHIRQTAGVFEEYPLYHAGEMIGTLFSRPFVKKEIAEKEEVFKRRTKNFLLISFLIAGMGSFFIAILFSRYLSNPITRLKEAAERVAKGDFSVRTVADSHDEVGRLAEVFNKMAESLQKEEKLRKQLMSNIAHELRTPLAIMKTQVEALADGIITDREKGLENINSEIEQLTKLVKGIEDVTTAEASFFSRSEETEVNLKEFLSGIAAELTPLFQGKNLRMELADKEDLFVNTDVDKLEIIIRNILSNSLKFTDRGGVTIHYGKEDKRFSVEISDTGNGIPEDHIPHIFDRFYRGEKADSEGLGLGLAIVKELVNVLRGEIRVKSKVGEGTSITVFLPYSVKKTA
jgi:two-component system sensor histidine kinase BaeS